MMESTNMLMRRCLQDAGLHKDIPQPGALPLNNRYGHAWTPGLGQPRLSTSLAAFVLTHSLPENANVEKEHNQPPPIQVLSSDHWSAQEEVRGN